MDKIDGLIKGYFENCAAGVSGRREDGLYPSSKVLVDYLADELKGEELQRMLDFIKSNPDAQTLISKARELVDSEGGWESEDVPAELVDRAKGLMPAASGGGACPHCGRAITPFKKGSPPQQWKSFLWLVLAAAFFVLSFGIPRYFYQCLAASLFFGFKWIIERRAAKTRIMIYKAISDDSASEQHRLHQHSSRL